MYLAHLHLEEFRSYATLDLDIDPRGVRIVGQNGSGKTSFIEAVVMLATTRSSRTSADREVVRWESGELFGVAPYARLEAEVQTQERRHQVTVAIELDRDGRQTARKTFTIDGQTSRAQDVIGTIKIVLFSPEDVQLVTGAPSERRRLIDMLISQIDRQYLRALSRYGRILQQRNGLLKRFAKERVYHGSLPAIAELAFWDDQLIESGAYVVASRQRMIGRLSELMVARSSTLIRDAVIGLTYQSKLELGPTSDTPNVASRAQELAVRFQMQLAEVRAEEFRRGLTVIGPHRDDVVFGINERDLATYGSRGQQRLGVVALKLSEGDLIAEATGEMPILLLDDVLSELDASHRELLLEAVATTDRQLLVTSTEADPLDHPALADLPLVYVKDGAISSSSNS